MIALMSDQQVKKAFMRKCRALLQKCRVLFGNAGLFRG